MTGCLFSDDTSGETSIFGKCHYTAKFVYDGRVNIKAEGLHKKIVLDSSCIRLSWKDFYSAKLHNVLVAKVSHALASYAPHSVSLVFKFVAKPVFVAFFSITPKFQLDVL